MLHTYILYVCIGLSAIVSVLVWIDYYRRIDVFEPDKIRHLLVAVLIGCGTPFISILVYRVFDYLSFEMNGEPLNDLLYSVFGIGLNEELSKIVGVIIAFRILKKQINESIDYLIYAGMVALGFALVENFTYIERFGIDILTERSFYSVLEHIINTSIIIYGYFRLRVYGKGKQFTNTIIALATAISSHGLFDYFIFNPNFKYISPVLVIIVYLIGINFWISMLNNAINYSSHFNYSKIQYTNKLFYRLLIWYFFTMLIGLVYKAYFTNMFFAIANSLHHIFSNALLFTIVILRASRFKIYKNYYQPITIQLPFYITKNNDEDFRLFTLIPIKIRGENSHEYFLTAKIDKEIEVKPVNPRKSFLQHTVSATVADKLFLDNDTTIYMIKLTDKNSNNTFFLKPKTTGKIFIDEVYPINELLVDDTPDVLPKKLSELRFLEFVFVKADNEVAKVNY